jgi:hypothetical protein
MRGLALVILVAACSGNSTSPLVGSDDQLTSLAPAKKMSELSRAEKQRLCEDFKTFQVRRSPSEDDQRKQKCAFQAAAEATQATDDPAALAACKISRDECIKRKEPVEKPNMDCNSDEVLNNMAQCPAITIGDMSECVKDMAEVMKKFAAVDLCASVKAGDQKALEKVFDQIKSAKCDALEARCKPSPADAAKLHAEALEKIESFKQKMCECKSTTCAQNVNEALQKWGGEWAAKTRDAKADDATAKKASELMVGYTECMTKVMTADAGSGSAGSGSGSGSAK